MSFSSNYMKLREKRAGASSGGGNPSAAPPEDQQPAAGENSFHKNYMALRDKRNSMTISEKAEKRVKALKEKLSTTASVDIPGGRKTGSGSYYTRPEFGSQSERLYSSVRALDSALAEKRTPLETAASALRQAESDLKSTQGYIAQAQAAYEQEPSEEKAAYYNQLTDAYEQAKRVYDGAFEAYSAAYDAYKPHEDQLIDALAAYQFYNEQQSAAFDAWRGTIRDASAIRQEIETVDAGIEEQETRIGSLEALTRGRSDALGASMRESLRKATEELQAMQRSRELLQEELDWSRHYRYADLMDAADFGTMSAYASTANGKEAERHPLSGLYLETGFDDLTYDYINRNEAARGKALVASIADNTALLGLDTSYLEQMTDDEIAIFNYLYATQGPDAAYEYTAYLTTTLTQRQRMAQEAQWAQYAEENPVKASAFSVAMSPMKGLSFLGQAADKAADGTIDQNAAYNKFSYTGSAIRNQVSEQIEKSGKWGAVGSFAYETGMSMGDFLLNTAITGGNQTLSLAIMGSGAAADTVIAGKDRGLSDDQAFTLGAVAGLAEIAMEKISLDTLLNPSLLRNGSMKYILKNMVAEGGEEVGTDLINLLADVLITKDQSEWQQSIDGYVAQGKTEQEAFGAALKDQLLTMGLDFLGGALSGGVMGTGGAIVGNRYTSKQAQELEQLELSEEDIQAFIETGLESDQATDAYHIARELQQKLEAGQELSSNDLSRLYQANIQAVYEEQKTEEQPEGLTLRAVDAEETAPAPVTQNQGKKAENNAAPWQQEPEWNGGTVHGEYEQNGRSAAAQTGSRPAAGEYVPDGSGERLDGAGAGEQAGILAGGPVGAARRRGTGVSDAGRAAVARQNLARNLRLEKVSSQELGLSNGTEAKNVQVMPQEHWDEDMGRLAYRVYQETGRNVTFVLGRIQIRTAGGIGYARGVITPDRLIVQADNLNVGMERITDHELYHAKTDFAAEMGADLTAEIRERVLERFTEEEFDQVLDLYIEALRGVIDVAGAQSLEEYTRAVRQVEEELLADAYAGINAFGAGADRFTDVVNEGMDRIGMGKRREQDYGTEQHTGPPYEDRFSIETLPDGNKYVRADRQVIFGNDPDSWSEQVEDYINGRIRRGQDVTLIAEDGDVLTITSTTAGKLADNHTSRGTTMSDEDFYVKANAAVHIDELAKVSSAVPGVTRQDVGGRHGEFASGGWTYRTAFFMDFDGKYYRLRISAAKNPDGTIVYNIGDVKERSFPTVDGSSAKGGALGGKTSFKKSVPQADRTVKQRFSYAGENANNADLEALARAKEMQKAGVDEETIRQQTGWHIGMDGKWRWEIDDSGMHYDSSGDLRGAESAKINMQNYEDAREDLWDHADMETLEKVRAYNRADIAGDKETRAKLYDELMNGQHAYYFFHYVEAMASARKARNAPEGGTLQDYIEHPALFEAYPQLRNVSLRFETMSGGNMGYFSAANNEIVLNRKLRYFPEDVLVHEIQHAIQRAEGFARGSSVEYWQQFQDGEGAVRTHDAEIQDHEKKVSDIMRQLPENVAEQFRSWYAMDESSPEAMALMQELGDGPYGQQFNDYFLLTWSLDDMKANNYKRGSRDLYENTAGEIEARDSAARRTLTPEQRRGRRPVRGGDKTVFVEDAEDLSLRLGDRYSVDETDSLGNVLSEEQQKFFRDSKVRDAQGRLMVVYHGSTAQFTTFDKSRGRYGVYLTANRDLADSYGTKTIEAYANITNPKRIDAEYAKANTMDMSKIAREAHEAGHDGVIISNLIHAGNQNYDAARRLLDPDAMAEAEMAEDSARELANEFDFANRVFAASDDIIDFNLMDEENLIDTLLAKVDIYDREAHDHIEALRPIYNRIRPYIDKYHKHLGEVRRAENERAEDIADKVYIVFAPEQIKSVDNRKPTEDPDIRYSYSDTEYMDAVERGDVAAAQRMADKAAEHWGAYLNNDEANEIFPQDGKIRTFYHGTNTGDFNTFDAGLLGSSSGDLGWFGKGFYFAFSRDEAATYGRRVIPAYLKMRKPFDYSQLYKFNGSDKGASEYARFAWVYNITKQFPELAKGQKVWAYPDDAEVGSAVSWKQLAGWMDRIQKKKQFTVEEVEQGDGTTAFELRTDPEKNSWTNPDGETFEWTEYGMRRLFATERDAKEPINQIGAYLEEKLGIKPIPRRTIEEIDFSGAVQRAGYDGIIQSMSGDEAVVFSPEQIKSAEPVTYDDDGNVIPLSKRFDAGNADIRYSVDDTAGAVERYMDEGEGSSVFRTGWLSRNQSVAEEIVKHRPQTVTAAFRRWFGESTAVNAAGEPLVVFHGSQSRFTSFRSDGRPIWFSSNPVYAGAYATDRRKVENVLPGSAVYAGADQRMIPAYIRAEHPADFGDTDRSFAESAAQLAADLGINEEQLHSVWEQTGRKEHLWETVNTPEMTELLRSHGYDSVRARESGTPTWGIFDGAQAKSAVANTGSFDDSRADIRYSTEEEGGTKKQTTKKKVGPIAESRPIIAKRNLKNAVLDTFSIPSGMRAAMGDMIDLYADRLLKNGSLSEEDRQFFFDRLYESGIMTMPAEEYYAEARNYMKGGRIYVSDDVVADLGDDWNDIRKRAFAAGIYLTRSQMTDGHRNTGIDVWNGELAADLPGLFDSEETDQRSILERIIWVAEAGKEEQLSLQEYTARLAQQEYVSEDEILDNLERQMDWALRTFAESARLEIKLRDRTGVKIAEERGKATWRAEQQRAKEAKHRAEERGKATWRAEQQRAKEAKRRADERQARKENAKRQKERRELRELQQKTLKQLQWLSKNWQRAPEELKETWNEVLGDIDLYAVGAANEMHWSDKHGATWKDLAQMYKDAQKNDPNFLPSKELERIVARLDGTKIAEMDVGALQDLYKAAIGLRTEFYNRNNVINDEMQRLFAEVYSDVKREMEAAPGGFTGGVMDKLMNLDQLTPMNVMQRMAGWDPDSAFFSMAKQLERGERDMHAYSVRAQKMLQEFLTEHEDWVKKADGQGEDAIWYEVEVPQLLELGMGDAPIFGSTVKVYMTPAQKVHMYLESKNLDNLRHMTGGRTFVNKELYSKGKRQEALSQGRTIRLAPETVRKLVSDLTPEEMELARILDRYYNTFATQEINKVSNILYGYDKAMGKNYAPIYTNRNYTKTEFGVFDTTAEGVGNLKGRQYAVNPSYNISAFDAFERHVDQTARFCGMAIPARNWTTLMNWREQNNSTGDVITHKWGEESKRYIADLITTLQGGDSAKTDTISAGVSKLQSKYITAIFGANPSIVLKQLGSIPLAGAYLDARNVPTLAQIQGIDRDLIANYTQELEWRTMGYTTPETKQLKDNPNWTQTNKTVKFVFGGGAITAMDGWAASTLWPWAENKVRREHPELEMGTEKQVAAGESPFYRKVAEEFENALTRSQSVSDEIHQGTLRKSKNPITKAFTMFRSDSAQTYNTLRQKIGEAQFYARTGAKAEVIDAAKKAVGTAFVAMMLNAAWAEAINFVMALWKNKGKYYRDDDDELTIMSAGGEMVSGMLGSFAGIVTGGEELFDIIGNILTGDTWYGIDTPGMEQLTDMIETISKAVSGMGKVAAGGWDVWKNGGDVGAYLGKNSGKILGNIKDLAEVAATYLPGMPVSNLEAYLLGAVKWVSPELGAAYDDLFSDVGKSDLAGAEGRTLQSRIGGILSGRNISESRDTAEALAALYEAGHKTAVPSDTPTSISVDGEKRTLGAHQQQAYDTIWGGVVADALDDIVASELFAEADVETQAKMLSNLYSYAAEQAKMELFDDYEPDSGAVKNAAIVAAGASVAECITWNTITSGMRSAAKSAELATWDLTDPAKRAIFLNKISDSREDTIDAFREVGLSFDQFLQAYSKYGEINDMDLKASGKALEFAHWTSGQGYTAEQAAVVKDELTYFNMTPASSSKYEKLVNAGMDPEEAYDLAGELNGLQAEDGADSVSDLQKWRASVDFSDDVEDQLTALYAVMTETQYQKVEIANNFGVSPDAYVTFQEVKPRFDANGNGSYTNAEIKAAVDSMGASCTKEQKAVLWQLATGSKSAKNNPYSPQIGQKVLDAKAAAKEAAAREVELEGLTLGGW